MRGHERLLRWLGPWSDVTRRPDGVNRSERTLAADSRRSLRAWVYEPEDMPRTGCFLVAHGLNALGPRDPRFDRIMRILAHAGFLVMCPFLPDYTALRITAEVVDDFSRSLEALLEFRDLPCPPGLLSVSFGSFPALCVASSPDWSEKISGTIVFGGYGDLDATLRFAINGDGSHARDPLSMPAVALNLAERVSGVTPAVEAGWFSFAAQTWGRPEMKALAEHRVVAERIARLLKRRERALFMLGCGLGDEAARFWLDALAQKPLPGALDPRPSLIGLKRPLHLMHGIDDDVIPHSQLDVLAEAVPPDCRVERYLTGLYDHTRASGTHSIPLLLDEGHTLLRMIGALVRCGA